VTSDFADLGLRPELLTALAGLGYEESTPIQARAIPVLVAGSDLLGQAATGTGKTAAFALPILQTLDPQRGDRSPAALVLVPTRELALQVAEAFHSYGRALGVRTVAVYGGTPARHQIDALRRGVDVVVATPGRALDLANRGVLRLGSISTAVLDEADEMLEMGFIEDIEALLALTPADRQTVLFSATMPKRIDVLANRHLRDPERITVKARKLSASEVPRVRQVAFLVTRPNKPTAIGRILDAEDPVAAIVFCRTRGGVDDLTDLLTARGYQAEALHGGLTQDQRDRVMGRLRSGATELLIATDVAARGLDVDLLTHVINYDLPMTPEAYVHRVGRVGRAGREGVALSLVEPREKRMLDAIEKLTGGQVAVEPILTLTDVRRMRLDRTRRALEELMGDPDAQSRMNTYRDAVVDLLDTHDAVEVALAAFTLAHEADQGTMVDDDDRDLSAPSHASTRSGSAAPKGKGGAREESTGPKKRRERPSGPMTRIYVSLGRKAGVTPADIVGAFTGEAGLKGGEIGTISVHEKFTMAEVPADRARKVVKALQGVKIKGRKTLVRLDRDE